jgi:aspartate racemase
MYNRIGILGGMGPEATLHFMQLLYKSLSEALHPCSDQEYPDMTILMENTTPDRTEAIQEENPETAQRINKAIANLILSGCDPVAIPCITAHALVEPRWFDAGVIDFRQCVIDRYETDTPQQVAILATEGGLVSELFSPLADYFDIIFPSRTQQKKIMSIIYGPRGLKAHDTDIGSCKTGLDHIVTSLRNQGTEYFLAGCTEIETFVSNKGLDRGFILPMALMCQEIVDRVGSDVLNR